MKIQLSNLIKCLECLEICFCYLDQCIVEHPLVRDLLDRNVLEINLRQDLAIFLLVCLYGRILFRTERSVKGEPDTKQFENKSYRFSAYRSMFFWLDKKKGSKQYRRALPACLGTLIQLCFVMHLYLYFYSYSCEVK